MLFNNFVEGSLKLKPFDVHITQTIVKKIKMKAFIFFLQIVQLIETSYLYIYIFSYKFFSNPSTHQIFLISIFLIQIQDKFSKNFTTIYVSRSPRFLRFSTLVQLSFNSPQLPFKIPPKSFIYIQSSRRALDRHPTKKPPRTLTPKP